MFGITPPTFYGMAFSASQDVDIQFADRKHGETADILLHFKLNGDKSPLYPVCSAGPALTMGRSRTRTKPRACCHTVPSTCLSLLVNVLICSLYVSSLWLAYYQFIELCMYLVFQICYCQSK